MGSLIQTKGTQRLVKLFNNRFADLVVARQWRNAAGTTTVTAFGSGKLRDISDNFIAQNANVTAPANWPADMNDLFYPSATLSVVSISAGGSTLTFNVPGTKPDAIVPAAGGSPGSAVSCINKPARVDKHTTVNTASLAGGVLTVTLSKPTSVVAGDLVSFAKGKHERLVRRWRWYLRQDLKPVNNDAIRDVISTALTDDDGFFKSIIFQTIEDTQRVVATSQPELDNNDEPTGNMVMSIVLLTQATTAPDPLDPQ
jgi:hypothetical protein